MKRLLFACLLLISTDLFAENMSRGMEQMAWNFIEARFMNKNLEIDIYRNNIQIELNGMISPQDTILFSKLVEQLSSVLTDRKIKLYYGPTMPQVSTDITGSKMTLCNGSSNLVFNIVDKYKDQTSRILKGSILYRKIDLKIPANSTDEERKKIFYYYLYRSLVNYSSWDPKHQPILGCVFFETDPQKITYSSFDAFILKKLYSPDFLSQYKAQFIKTSSSKKYFAMVYSSELQTFFYSFGYLLSWILITIFVAKGVFKSGKQNWAPFLFQGSLIVLVFIIRGFTGFLADLSISKGELDQLISYTWKALLAVNAIYFTENLIWRFNKLPAYRIPIMFLVTLIVVGLFSLSIVNKNWEVRNVVYMISFIFIPVIRCLYIFVVDQYRNIISQKEVELARINELHKQAELQSLQAKINPHFLYNSLNTIASLASADARKTEQMALSLSDFYKYAINREQKQFNPLEEELKAIRIYLDIEKVRFGDQLDFEIDCPEDLLSVQIPRLLIQPLVENAVKHGLSKITGKGVIRIRVEKTGEQVKIKIYDNGPDFPEGPLSGYGIQNTQERLALIYGDRASLNWYNGKEKHLEIKMPYSVYVKNV